MLVEPSLRRKELHSLVGLPLLNISLGLYSNDYRKFEDPRLQRKKSFTDFFVRIQTDHRFKCDDPLKELERQLKLVRTGKKALDEDLAGKICLLAYEAI